jgi:hypothetical protein
LDRVEPNFAVEAELRERISDREQITFAEFMEHLSMRVGLKPTEHHGF